MAHLVPDDYGRVYRLLEQGLPVELELSLDNRFHPDHFTATNILAEIPGSDATDEVVIFGAHFDSWHGGTGASDNGAGVAIAMEAMRLLHTLDAPLHRTVRLALWGMEENPYPDGAMTHVLRNYARCYPSDGSVTRKRPGHSTVSAYFNVDHGAGRIRGVYSNGNDAAMPMLRSWLSKVADIGAGTLSSYVMEGSDHDTFNWVGIPGFMFIQDPGPAPGGYHGNLDTFGRVVLGDLQQAAAVLASVVFLAANDPEMVPRAPTELADADAALEERLSSQGVTALTGSYRSDDGVTMDVTALDGALAMSRPDRLSHWELFQCSTTSFSSGVGSVAFDRPEEDVRGLTLTTRNGSRYFVRVSR
jgi:hypothetical protein